jgi:hypothetical protein
MVLVAYAGPVSPGIISARLSCQGVKRSFWDPETFAQRRRHVPWGAPSRRSG